MPDEQFNEPDYLHVGEKNDKITYQFRVTVYYDGLKIVGKAFWAIEARSSSRRASDFLHSLPSNRVTLADVRVYDSSTGLVIDEPPFIVVNMQRISAIYADDIGEP